MQELAQRIKLARDLVFASSDGLKRATRLLIADEIARRSLLERRAFRNLDLNFCLVGIVKVDDHNLRSVDTSIGEIGQNQIAVALELVGRFEPRAVGFDCLNHSLASANP